MIYVLCVYIYIIIIYIYIYYYYYYYIIIIIIIIIIIYIYNNNNNNNYIYYIYIIYYIIYICSADIMGMIWLNYDLTAMSPAGFRCLGLGGIFQNGRRVQVCELPSGNLLHTLW